MVLGQQRMGVNLLSLIATLREEGRLPIRSVQWYLDTVHQLRLSVGAVDQALSDAFSGVLVSDFYAAYHHYDGPKQRCWAHPCSSQGQALLRDIHDQRTRYPDAAPRARWADAVHGIFTTGPKPALIPRPSGGAPPNWPWNDNCWPFANPSGTTRRQPKPQSTEDMSVAVC